MFRAGKLVAIEGASSNATMLLFEGKKRTQYLGERYGPRSVNDQKDRKRQEVCDNERSLVAIEGASSNEPMLVFEGGKRTHIIQYLALSGRATHTGSPNLGATPIFLENGP